MIQSDSMRSSARTGRQSAEVAERTRRAIVDAALTLFADRGFDGVSLRDIAKHAGTAHGLIRHHLGSKDDVWRAVVDEADARYVAALPRGLLALADGGAEASLRDVVSTVVTGLTLASWRHPEITRLLLHEGAAGGERLDYLLRHIQPLRRISDPLLARLHAAGLLTDHDEQAFFLLLVGTATMPLALAPLTAAVLPGDRGRRTDALRHAARITGLLVPGGCDGEARRTELTSSPGRQPDASTS